MRVCITLSGLGLVDRGIEVLIKEISKRLAGRIDLTVLAGGCHLGEGYISKKLHVIPRHYFKNVSPLTGKLGLTDINLECLSFVPSCVPNWLKNNYDIILNFQRFTVECSSFLKMAGMLNSKLVYSDQGGSPLKGRVIRHDAVIVTAPCYQGGYSSLRCKTYVIPNGVDVQTFNPKNDGDEIRKKYGLSEDDFTVFSVGEFIPWKGFDLLIQAVGKIPDAYLLLCGGGRMEGRLKDLAAKIANGRVFFIGRVPHREISKYYAACDVFAFGSYGEPFGIVLLEAMASGKPVIAHDAPAQRWIIGEGGLAINVKDILSFSKAISCFRDKGLREKVGIMARERIKRYFSWNIIAEKYLCAFREIYKA